MDKCLESVALSRSITFETIVVTSDPKYDREDGPKVYFEKGGPAHKRNYGVERSRSSIIVFLDDDVVISPYCLYYLNEFLTSQPHAAMVFAKIFNMERRQEFDDCGSWLTPTGFLYARAGNGVRDTGQYDEECRILASKSATCAIKRNIFYEVGGFDASYYILGEETDLAWRCWLKGHEVWYTPLARSWHAFNTSLKPKADYYTLERIHFHGCKNYLNLLMTNLGNLQLIKVLPIHITAWVVAAVSFALRGKFQRSFHIMRGMWWNAANIWPTLKKRRKVQSGRRISDKSLMSIIMRHPPRHYYIDRLRRYITQGLHG